MLMFQKLQKYCLYSLLISTVTSVPIIAHFSDYACSCFLSAFGPSVPHLLHFPLGWALFSPYSLWQVARSEIRTVMGGGLLRQVM